MTRTEAAHSVRNRWQRLGIGTPEEFPHVFRSDVDNMLELSSTGNILDVAEGAGAIKASVESIGDEGSVGNLEKSESPRCAALLIERLIGSVIRAEEHAAELAQYRAEENDAAEEGALIEASGYNDPVYERNGR